MFGVDTNGPAIRDLRYLSTDVRKTWSDCPNDLPMSIPSLHLASVSRQLPQAEAVRGRVALKGCKIQHTAGLLNHVTYGRCERLIPRGKQTDIYDSVEYQSFESHVLNHKSLLYILAGF